MTAAAELYRAKQARFLTHLAETGQVTKSAIAAGWDRVQAYRLKAESEQFAELWADALEAYADKLEAEAFRRAVEGTQKGVWHQGVRVGNEQQYSDSLLALMLKAKRKREYGDASKLELTGADGGPVKVEESPYAIGRRIAFALTVAARAKPEERSANSGPPDAASVDPDSGEDMA
jgi:hypothetical protein